jgi:peptide/nickel transport system permease protein
MALPASDAVVPGLALPRLRSRLRGGLDLWVPAAVLAAMAVACFLVPLLGHVPGPNAGLLSQTRLPPLSRGHLLGTDALGNDLLSRSLYGGQVSIEVGLGSVALGMTAGGVLGILAGYKGAVYDSSIMRLLDMILAFPPLVLALAVASYLGPNEQDVIFAIAFFTTPATARLARAQTLKLREREFIVAAELAGHKARYILRRHVVPNVAPSLLTFGLTLVAVAMIIEAALDFLGLGIRPPEPSWGSMIASGQSYLSTSPWIVFVPTAFLFVTVTSLNLLGNAIRARWASS